MAAPFPTWETAIERFGAHRRTKDLKDRYRREELRVLRTIRAAFPATDAPRELTEDLIGAFFLDLKRRGLSNRTRLQYATALRLFLTYLREPAAAWVPGIPQPQPAAVGRYLEQNERAALWAACVTAEDRLILTMGLGNGLRRSDMLGARMEDLLPSPEAPTTLRVHGKGERGGPVELVLHPKWSETLPAYLTYRTAMVGRAVSALGPSVLDPGTLLLAFSWSRGLRSMGRTAFDSRVSTLYARSGVDTGGQPSHSLRKTWAENRLEALVDDFTRRGMDPALVLEMALRQLQREGRWKSIETLRQSYLRRHMAPSAESWARTAI